MDFRVSEEQKALRDGVRSFCQERVGVERLHQLAARGGFDRSLWHELAELGVFSLRRPEQDGGSGLGMADAALVFEELGRCVAPGRCSGRISQRISLKVPPAARWLSEHSI